MTQTHILLSALIVATLLVGCGSELQSQKSQEQDRVVTQPINVSTDGTSDPEGLNTNNVFDINNIIDAIDVGSLADPDANLTLAAAAHLQAQVAFNLEQSSNLTRPALLPKCSSLASYTTQFGCTQAVQYNTVGGGTAWASADVKIYPAYQEPLAQLGKVAFFVAPHTFGLPSSINHEFGYSVNTQSARLFQQLRTSGVSVAFIAFGHALHTQKILRSKAIAVADAITTINGLKRDDSKSLLMGFSLGGIIGRVALRSLEVGGINNHNVSHYISVDSPHRGAHVPLGLQNVLTLIKNGTAAGVRKSERFQDRFGTFIDDILDLDDIANNLEDGIEQGRLVANQIGYFSTTYLTSSFARELLMQQATADGYVDSRYVSLQNYINSIGMPQMSRNIGVASGSITGQNLTLPANYYVTFNSSKQNYVEIDFTAFVAKRESVLFSGVYKYPDPTEILGDSIFGSGGGTDSYTLRVADQNAIRDYDNLPCGSLDAVRDLETELNKAVSAMFPEKLQIGNDTTCFIPTTSALAMTTAMNYRGQASAQLSLFDEVVGDSQNKAHLEISAAMGNRLVEIIRAAY